MKNAINKGAKEQIVLVFGTDSNYVMPLAVALHSTLVHLDRDCSILLYIIDGGIGELNRRRIQRVVEASGADVCLNWVSADMSSLNDLKVSHHVTLATYFTILVPDLIPEKVHKAIYLDCDILVENSLKKLWQAEVDKYALLAVRDFLISDVSSSGGLSKYHELGLDPHMHYFNAGVMVLNLKRWRKKNISQKVMNYLQNFRDYLNFRDQEGLNAVLAGDWGPLDPKWNVGSSILYYDRWIDSNIKEEIRPVVKDLLRDPYIIHFTSERKPWNLDCEHPAKVKWRHYLEESRWFDPVTDSLTEGNFAAAKSDTPITSIRSASKVTIAIPTHNRSNFLVHSLNSVLSQSYSDFQIVILDNASTDETEEVVQSHKDPRIIYVRNDTNTGLFGNWNKALEINTSPYLCILPDDDLYLSGFIEESTVALDSYPTAAFSTCLARFIDADGVPLDLQDSKGIEEGLINGTEFLKRLIGGLGWKPNPAAIMIRSSALKSVGHFIPFHSKQLLDFNLMLRLMAGFDTVFLSRELVQVRIHDNQIKEREFKAIEGTKQLAMISEYIDVIAYLLNTRRVKDASFRRWLSERLITLNRERSKISLQLIPSINLTWNEQQQIAAQDIADVIPQGDKFIYADRGMWIGETILKRHAIPFLEQNGQYWGIPPDDQSAIREVERMRQAGAKFIVFSSSVFWWFDHYRGFIDYLESKYPCKLRNERVVIFDLRS
jgi:lipopolysaccharide biosynthesis glycosyltransferase